MEGKPCEIIIMLSRQRLILYAVLIGLLGLALLVDVDQWLGHGQENYSALESGLWMGGNVKKPPSGTRAVLNLCELEDPYHAEMHVWRPINDTAPAPSLDWLQAQVNFIDVQRQAGLPVYVHCRNGVSRSGMVMAAYYMSKKNMTRDEALTYLRQKRPGVRPHPVFMDRLLEWEAMLHKKNSPQR
jgi:hypothetical protein